MRLNPKVILSACILIVTLHGSLNLEGLDQEQSLFQFLTPLFLLICILISMAGLGSAVYGKLGIHQDSVANFSVSLSLGAIMFSALSGFSVLLLPLPSQRALYAALILVGMWLGLRRLEFGKVALPEDRLDRFLVLVLFLSVLLSTISSFLLAGHGDSFICYLNATRSIAETGALQGLIESPIYFLSSSWENLYLWGFSFFAEKPFVGLTSGQRFAQLYTGLLAQGGMILMNFLIVRSLAGRVTPALISALAASTVPHLRWMQNLAKNDLGNLFWCLGGIFLLLENPGLANIFSALLAGAFFGMAVIGKLSNFSVLIFAGVFVFSKRVSAKGLVMFSLGGVLGALPVLLRNWILTENPFYPFLQSIFQGLSLAPTLGGGFTQQKLFIPALKLEYLLEFLGEQPWMFALIIAPFWFRFQGSSRGTRFSLAVLVQVFFFLTVFRPGTEIRYMGSGLALASAISILVVQDFFSCFLIFLGSRFVVPAMLLAFSNLPIFTLMQVFTAKYDRGDSELDRHSAGEAKRFIRKNHPGLRTVSLGDYESYYMMGRVYRNTDLDPELDQALGGLGEGAIRVFKEKGFDLVLDAHSTMGGLATQRSQNIARQLDDGQYPVLFESKGARVISLRSEILR